MRGLARPLSAGAVCIVWLLTVGTVARAASGGFFTLTAASQQAGYTPPFTGNGLLGVRVPAAGQGYAAGSPSVLAGFYAQPPGQIQQRANIPTWSTLAFADGAQQFSLSSGTTGGWRQSIDLHTGLVTTSARWTAPNGDSTTLTYLVWTDRARPDVGVVSLQLTPDWTGQATVTDMIDGTPATLSSELTKGWASDADRDWVEVQARGTGVDVAIASQLETSADVIASPVTEVGQSTQQTAGQAISFPVTAGNTYTITKYVAVDSSQSTSDPLGAAQAQAAGAAALGTVALRRASDAAWAALWNGRIDVLGNPSLATDVNASEFYLWASTRDDNAWSIPSDGLSSNGDSGHVSWDAETWIYPALLAQHPDLAAHVNAYRLNRLPAAQQRAAATGYPGARFPWESALDGTEQTSASPSQAELHITADVALAQWQYFLATGDKRWLSTQGWPVISQAADFWAARASLGQDGHYHILDVTGPDQANPNVDDDAYTNGAAATTLREAIAAAQVVGAQAPATWAAIASGLVVPVAASPQIHPEFVGYSGQLVKQADVTMLQYPWRYPMGPHTASGDLDFYTPRTDPTGSSTSDAIGSIDSAALGTAGCSSYVFTQRSVQPSVRDAFDQFSATGAGGASTYMSGIGGFLQEFLYGYSGLRWGSAAITLAPRLTGQLGGLVLHDLSWHGRRFTVSIGSRRTTIKLDRGPALRVSVRGHTRTIRPGHSLRLTTDRPDLLHTSDAVMCQAARASSSSLEAPPLAAVDGSGATAWQPLAVPATLTVALKRARSITSATLRWGELFGAAPGLGVPPQTTLARADAYTLQVSTDGRTWRTMATVSRTDGTVDDLRLRRVKARFVRVAISSASASQPPLLQELSVG